MTTAPTAPVIQALPVPNFMSRAAAPEQIGPPKSFMLYGPPGTRKTSSIGDIVKHGRFNRVVYLDADNGTEVFANDPEVFAATKDGRITIIPVDTTTMSPSAVVELIEQTIFEIAGVWRTPAGHLEPHPGIPDFGVDLVVLDTLNIIQQAAVKHFMATTMNDKGTALDPRAAWGRVSVWTDEIVRLMHNSSRFTGAFIAHPKEVEAKNGSIKVKPQLQGSIKDNIGSIPSLVVYLDYEQNPETKETELVATVGESESFESKNRYMFPSKMRAFNLNETYAVIDAKTGRTPSITAVPAPQATPIEVEAPAETPAEPATQTAVAA